MSYNADRDEVGRQLGDYAAQILKGAKPSDIPVVFVKVHICDQREHRESARSKPYACVPGSCGRGQIE